jgi:hypothetical protein
VEAATREPEAGVRIASVVRASRACANTEAGVWRGDSQDEQVLLVHSECSSTRTSLFEFL